MKTRISLLFILALVLSLSMLNVEGCSLVGLPPLVEDEDSIICSYTDSKGNFFKVPVPKGEVVEGKYTLPNGDVASCVSGQ